MKISQSFKVYERIRHSNIREIKTESGTESRTESGTEFGTKSETGSK